MNWFVSIACTALPIFVFIYRKHLKRAFNANSSFWEKQVIFGLVLIAPIVLLVGISGVYANITFLINKDALILQCVENARPQNAVLVAVEQHWLGVKVSFEDPGTGEAFWCMNKGGEPKYF